MSAGRWMDSVAVWPAPADPRRLSIEVGRSPPPPPPPEVQGAVEAEWARLLAANPRMFDGTILAVVGEDLAAGKVRCRADSFKRLAVQGAVGLGVELLAVSGVIIARDARGREHVFLGRRHPQTRIYGGMWELGPAGGVPPPHPARDLGLADVLRQLEAEIHEEAGLHIDVAPARLIGFCRDRAAHSLDLVMRLDPQTPLEALRAGAAPRDWEYADVRWQPLDELPAFDREHGAEIIAPTRAAFRFLGWVQD